MTVTVDIKKFEIHLQNLLKKVSAGHDKTYDFQGGLIEGFRLAFIVAITNLEDLEKEQNK